MDFSGTACEWAAVGRGGEGKSVLLANTTGREGAVSAGKSGQ